MSEKTAETGAFFGAFCRHAGLAAGTEYAVVSFGDSAAMAEELARLVLDGRKRATTSLLRDFSGTGEALPKRGDYVVVVDAGGRPLLVWRTTKVEVKPFREVDAAFAWDEGEGDRTLEDWLRGHRAFFTRELAREGFVFDEGMQAVFERFAVVWPAEVADG